MNHELMCILNICENISKNNRNNIITPLIYKSIEKKIAETDNTNLISFLSGLSNISSDCQYRENFYENDDEDEINPCVTYTIDFSYLGYSVTLLYHVIFLINIQETKHSREIYLNKIDFMEEIDMDNLIDILKINNIENIITDVFTLLFDNFETSESLWWI